MHEEATIITTTAASSKVASNIINNHPHQSITIDNNNSTSSTTTISIVHHLHHHHHSNATVIENFHASVPTSSTNATASLDPTSSNNLISQIVSPQTKIFISSNAVEDIVDDHHVILNGAIANPNDPNVLIVGTNSSCDNDKNDLTLNIQNNDLHHMEIEIVENATIGSIEDDECGDDSDDGGEGEHYFTYLENCVYFAKAIIKLMSLNAR